MYQYQRNYIRAYQIVFAFVRSCMRSLKAVQPGPFKNQQCKHLRWVILFVHSLRPNLQTKIPPLWVKSFNIGRPSHLRSDMNRFSHRLPDFQ